MCSDALEDEPECLPLLVLRARANVALRRELEAQADCRDIIRIDPHCAIGYRLLGELAARRDENDSAVIFFREALRLDPDDHEAGDWLKIVERSLRPAAVAQKLPAPATAAGRFPRAQSPDAPRFARGTYPPDQHAAAAAGPAEERATQPFARALDRNAAAWRPTPHAAAPTQLAYADDAFDKPTAIGRPSAPAPAKPAPRVYPRPASRSSVPELPGFGEYLVSSGILTRERLRAAQAYQRSMKVQLATAIVTLGLATPQRIEWAAVAHQSQLSRGH